MKVWYTLPGCEAVEGTTQATFEQLSKNETVLIEIADKHDSGVVRLAVPSQYVFAQDPRSTNPIDRAWFEAFTSKGYRYGQSEEENAKAWFAAGWKMHANQQYGKL